MFLNRDSCYEVPEFLFSLYWEILKELAWPGIFLSELVIVSRPGPAPAGPGRPKGRFTVHEIQKQEFGSAVCPPFEFLFPVFGPPSPR